MSEIYLFGKNKLMMSIKKNHILLLLLACFAIFFVNLDALYINIMEARNFITLVKCYWMVIGYSLR